MDDNEITRDFYTQHLSPEEAKATTKIIRGFMETYAASSGKQVSEWLPEELAKQLPGHSEEDIRRITREIISSLEITEEKKNEQGRAIQAGRDKESWLRSSLEQSTSHMTAEKSTAYLQELDTAIKQANEQMSAVITTKAGEVNQNPHLDGYIAEQALVNSFNMDAAAKGSKLLAEVRKPAPGETYAKNSFDAVIKNEAGKIVHQYQMKYGATADHTIQLIKNGNYNNQILVVPAEQVDAVKAAFPGKTVKSTIEADGIRSAPLTKTDVKEAQLEAQNGGSLDVDWSGYSPKDIAKGISQNVTNASLQGAAIGAGMTVLSKMWNDEPIDGAEVVETALETGADFGVKAAVAGGLKVAAEKGVLTCLQGTPAGTFANIAFVAVENVKVLGKVATGKLTLREGVEEMQRTTGACVAGIAAGTFAGTQLGSIVGSVFGPVGTVIGGVVGSAVGYMAGSKFGETVVRGAQKIGKAVVNVVKKGVEKVGEFARNAWSWLETVFA